MTTNEILDLPLETLEELVTLKKQMARLDARLNRTAPVPARTAASHPSTATAAKPAAKHGMSDAMRKQVSEKLKARWAEKRKQAA